MNIQLISLKHQRRKLFCFFPRIEIPCRGARCKHIQCFDFKSFLYLNISKSRALCQFICPICSSACSLAKVYIDPVIAAILSTAPESEFVQIFRDGTFSTSCNPSMKRDCSSNMNQNTNAILIDLVGDECLIPSTSSISKSTSEISRQHVHSLLATFESMIRNDNRPVESDKVVKLDDLRRVRLMDVLFFLNNAPWQVFTNVLNKAANKFHEELVNDLIVFFRSH